MILKNLRKSSLDAGVRTPNIRVGAKQLYHHAIIYCIYLSILKVIKHFDFDQNQIVSSLTKFINKYSNNYNTKLASLTQ